MWSNPKCSCSVPTDGLSTFQAAGMARGRKPGGANRFEPGFIVASGLGRQREALVVGNRVVGGTAIGAFRP